MDPMGLVGVYNPNPKIMGALLSGGRFDEGSESREAMNI